MSNVETTVSHIGYTEAKSYGYDLKALRKVVAMRKMDNAKRLEAGTVLETFMLALGML